LSVFEFDDRDSFVKKRIAARFVVKHYVIDISTPEQCRELFSGQISLIRRVLFSRSLRLLPLPEQVGAVEALAVIVDQVPEVIPLTDQHLLAFLSELLKMSSVADGEMSDANLVGYVVDKNGYAVSAQQKPSSSKDANSPVCSEHASGLFLRRECILRTGDKQMVITEELPPGVQLRVSSICLLRSVIRGHPDAFFDAESATPIGKLIIFNFQVNVIRKLTLSIMRLNIPQAISGHM
jgi:transformation/transcription domain-associated protein